ncbi:hypothetical protein T07_10395 [Trichinella nelsoni]|uniref:Uncharacterized protein n=1 Tax=Trichinella nelsoni TaxID=6336 RepID=A0A0V0S428_9BILA|nr:hypothetical protein T07_10395 [Trichinella nelsoni]
MTKVSSTKMIRWNCQNNTKHFCYILRYNQNSESKYHIKISKSEMKTMRKRMNRNHKKSNENVNIILIEERSLAVV